MKKPAAQFGESGVNYGNFNDWRIFTWLAAVAACDTAAFGCIHLNAPRLPPVGRTKKQRRRRLRKK